MVTGGNRNPARERAEPKIGEGDLAIDVDVDRRGVRRGVDDVDSGFAVGADAEGGRAAGRAVWHRGGFLGGHTAEREGGQQGEYE
jgi:hypothetical protein